MSDNDRLRSENDLLHQEIDRGSAPPKQGSRFRRLLVFGVAVGTAYVFGTRAGRERYDEIRSWWDRMRGRAVELKDDFRDAAAESTETASSRLAERVRETSDSASDALKTGGDRAAERVVDVGQKTADAARRD
jgi:hypothetical protein